MPTIYTRTSPEATREAIKTLTDREFLEFKMGEIYYPVIIKTVHDIAKVALAQFAVDPPSLLRRQTTQNRLFAERSLPEIGRLTSPDTVGNKYYQGDHSTLSEVWCMAAGSDSENCEIDLFVFEGDVTAVTLSSPVACEESGCKNHTSEIYISRAEYDGLLYKRGSAGFKRNLFGTHAGAALCGAHSPKRKTIKTD